MKKLLIIAFLLAGVAIAQKAPTPNANIQLLNNSGAICQGCQLVTCGAGLSCPLSPGVNAAATYTTAGGGAQNTNPIILDSAGRANVWLTPTVSYKFALFDPVGVPIWTVDNIPGGSTGASGLTVGTTTIGSGTSGYIEFNNSGVLGEKAVTGTGNVVLATSPTVVSPTMTGTATVNNLVIGGTCTGCSAATGLTVGTTTIASGANGSIEYNNSGVLGEKPTTGTGNVVLSASPTLTGTAIVNNLTVGGTCTGCNAATGLTVGSTTVTSGTSGRIEYNNAGTLGEYPITGTGNVVLSASPTMTGTAVVNNLTVGGTCTGCSSGLTVGGTTIASGTNGQLLYETGGVLGQTVLEDFPTFQITGQAGGITNGLIANSVGASNENDLWGGAILSSGSTYFVIYHALSAYWTGNIDINLNWFQTAGGAGNVIFSVQTGCFTNTTALPITYNAAQTVTITAGTANQYRTATISGLTTTGCSAGYTLGVKIARTADTYGSTIYFTGAVLGVRRTQ